MKFSKRFEKDYEWFKSMVDVFSFDGNEHYTNKKGVDIIQHDTKGNTAKECFYLYDSQGKIKPTSEPNKLKQLLKVKGSINLQIQMYAEDRARGYLPRIQFDGNSQRIQRSIVVY